MGAGRPSCRPRRRNTRHGGVRWRRLIALPAGTAIGLRLGTLGGGSIVTVPVLVSLLPSRPARRHLRGVDHRGSTTAPIITPT